MEPKRGYVVKETRDGESRAFQIMTLAKDEITKTKGSEITGAVKNRLFPTDMGMIVSDFLDQYFEDIMDYGFTADIEKIFDDVADGNIDWRKMLKDFYFPFHATVEKTIEEADRPTNERILGNDPETGRTVLTRMTRNGPVVQIGAPDELVPDEKPKYANLRPGQSINSITFEEAIKLFDLPKDLGAYKGEEVTIGVGRYGPYVRYGEKFVSIPKGEDPLEVGMSRAQELIDAKLKEDAPVGQYKDLPIQKGKGRFGPYLKWNSMFINVPRRYDFENISLDEMHELIAAKEEKEANRYIQKWDEESIALENGRWGPFIRFKKKSVKIPKVNDQRMTPEQAAELTLKQVKEYIVAEIPDAFAKAKKKATKKTTKKATKKSTTTKKSK
jgi:DNA topoisomerase-1